MAIELGPHATARTARCEECLTLVEVPFFRRQAPGRRLSNARQWAWVAIVAASAVMAAVIFAMIVSGNMRGERRRVFERLLSEAAADEQNADLENAQRRLDAAAQLAAVAGTVDVREREKLKARRERLSEARVAAHSARMRREAESSLTVANALLRQAAPDWKRLLDLCESATLSAEKAIDGEDLVEQARALAASVVRARGVVFVPPAGEFLFDGDGKEYARLFAPALEQTLQARGFLPQRSGTRLASVWDQGAPFRFSIRIKESHGPSYLDSPLRTARIDADLALTAGEKELWRIRVTARTRVPSSRFSAFESGYLASATKRDAKLESRLREDAVAAAVEQLPGKLVSFPAWSPAAQRSSGY